MLEFAQSQPPSTFLSIYNYCLEVHPWAYLILASKYITEIR
jgi:hypothetical protein